MCFDFFYNFETFLILRRIQRDIIKKHIGLHVKYRYSCEILMKLGFSRQIFEKCLISDFINIRPVGAELFHADKRTDRHE